jgi:hypothetical protein
MNPQQLVKTSFPQLHDDASQVGIATRVGCGPGLSHRPHTLQMAGYSRKPRVGLFRRTIGPLRSPAVRLAPADQPIRIRMRSLSRN